MFIKLLWKLKVVISYIYSNIKKPNYSITHYEKPSNIEFIFYCSFTIQFMFIITYRSFHRENNRSRCCQRRPRLIGPVIDSIGILPARRENCNKLNIDIRAKPTYYRNLKTKLNTRQNTISSL